MGKGDNYIMEVSLYRPQISRTWDGRNGKGEI